jgi:hypothetical protein
MQPIAPTLRAHVLAPHNAPSSAALPTPPTGPHLGGTWRWDVKTLTDPAAAQVSAAPHPTTMAAMEGFTPPPNLDGSTPRTPPTETTAWQIQAKLVQMQLEADGDIHLVLADPHDAHMQLVAEFPDAREVAGAPPALRDAIRQARLDLLAQTNQPTPPTYPLPPVPLSGTATLTGMGFFDAPHGQDGDAKNSIELHPVLGFHLDTPTSRSRPAPAGHA